MKVDQSFPTLYSPWNSPGQNIGVGSLALLQGILATQESNTRSPKLQADSLPAEPRGKPKNTGVSSLSLLQWIFLIHGEVFILRGFPDGSVVKEFTCKGRRRIFHPWVGKIPWRREWQSTPVFLPGESHGQRSLVGYSPWGRKESDST